MCASLALFSAGNKLSTLESVIHCGYCSCANILSTAGRTVKMLYLSSILKAPVAQNLPCTLNSPTCNAIIIKCTCLKNFVGNLIVSGNILCRTHAWVFNFSNITQTFVVILLHYFHLLRDFIVYMCLQISYFHSQIKFVVVIFSSCIFQLRLKLCSFYHFTVFSIPVFVI